MEEDIPEIYTTYTEAGKVFSISLRSSGYLLRKCLEMICKKLGASGNTLDAKINSLEKNGFTDIIEDAELIRLIGNEGAHGELNIDFNQRKEDVVFLFKLVNDVYNYTIL